MHSFSIWNTVRNNEVEINFVLSTSGDKNSSQLSASFWPMSLCLIP